MFSRTFVSQRIILAVLILASMASMASVSRATQMAEYSDTGAAPLPVREAFYCQAPDYAMIYGMSSGFNAEFADDFPIEFTGETISTVTLWLGQWYSMGGPGWTEPVGIRVNFYLEACPPELDPFITVEVPWNELDKTLVVDEFGKVVYEVRVHPDPPLVIGDVMSMGATALISWGQEEPFTGIVATPFGVSYGACPAWLDGDNWGYTRWTSIDFFTQIPQDLAYCLEGVPTDAVESPNRSRLIAHPNPFNPKTSLSASLEHSAHVSLRIHDIAGRHVATLFEGWREAGEFNMDWTGKDERGRSLGAGVYLAVLKAGNQEAIARLILLK